jgi:hypothetical protein
MANERYSSFTPSVRVACLLIFSSLLTASAELLLSRDSDRLSDISDLAHVRAITATADVREWAITSNLESGDARSLTWVRSLSALPTSKEA